MHKTVIVKTMKTAVYLFAAAMLLGNVLAQDTPATTQTAPAPSTPPASTASPKPKTATTAKKSTTTGTKTAGAPLALKTSKEKFSYSIGMKMGQNMKKQGVAVDPAILSRGLRDGLNGNKTLLTDDEAQAAIMGVQKEMQAKQQEKMKEMGTANKKVGDDFLAANKSKDGVKSTASGLQYKVLKQGDGPKPTDKDTVSVNYRGTLIDGKEFDSSYKRNAPATFPVTGVIKGWTEALQLMPVGSKYQLFIPADLAYGERGAGADIGPDSTLIFEVELLSIEDKSKAADKK